MTIEVGYLDIGTAGRGNPTPSLVRSRNRVGPIAGHTIMVALVFVSLFPVYWMIVTSFRASNEILDLTPWPRRISFENYAYALTAIPIFRMLWNTIVVSLAVTAFQVVTALLAAYAFARWNFVLARLVYGLVALTWLVPFQVVMIPNYVLVADLGLLDSLAALILPNIAAALSIMFLLQAMRSFPKEVLEAARMDGAGHWRVLWEIVAPNLRASLAAIAILTFISTWNEYFWPLLLTRAPETTVIQIGLQMFMTEEGTQWGPLMAASTLASVPVLAIYIVLQRQIIDSFVKAGLR